MKILDPSQPSQEEVIQHNMKVAKANLACELAKSICGDGAALGTFIPWDAERSVACPPDQDTVARFVIGLAEGIIENYSLMPNNNKMQGSYK